MKPCRHAVIDPLPNKKNSNSFQSPQGEDELHYVIRAARPELISELDELMLTLHEEHHQRLPCIFKSGEEVLRDKSIASYIHQQNHFVYVATCSEKIVGFVTGRVYTLNSPVLKPQYVGNIDEVYVESKFRSLGIARNLLQKLEESFVQHGATQVYLDVWALNTSALALYTKQNFIHHTHCMKKHLPE